MGSSNYHFKEKILFPAEQRNTLYLGRGLAREKTKNHLLVKRHNYMDDRLDIFRPKHKNLPQPNIGQSILGSFDYHFKRIESMAENIQIGAELSSLPLGQMLSGPLMAAIEAQAMSAVHTADFIKAVGFTDDDELATLPFKFNNVVTDPSTGEALERSVELSVPLLSIVEPPHLAITDLSVSFEFKIRDVMSKTSQAKFTSKSGTSASLEVKTNGTAGGGLLSWLGVPKASGSTTTSVKTNFNVSATYQQSARHDTDRSATLKMTMNAQQRVPEGFQRVMSILNDAIKAQAAIPGPATPPAGG